MESLDPESHNVYRVEVSKKFGPSWLLVPENAVGGGGGVCIGPSLGVPEPGMNLKESMQLAG